MSWTNRGGLNPPEKILLGKYKDDFLSKLSTHELFVPEYVFENGYFAK